MIKPLRPGIILLADDDAEDRMLTVEALAKNNPGNDIRSVSDGEELLDYLYQRGRYTFETAPRPHLILLDLNMPRLDGREALATIKGDEALRAIPVVVLTTSKAEEDVWRSYELGANSFVTKPVSVDGLNYFARAISDYWFRVVSLPDSAPSHADG